MERKVENILNLYLKHIEIELESLTPFARKEIIAEIKSHLVEEWQSLEEQNEENLLQVINNFGDPREIAADYLARSPEKAELQARSSYPPTWLILVLTIIFWPAGIILAWLSPAWQTRDKVIATLVPLVLPLATMVLVFAARVITGY